MHWPPMDWVAAARRHDPDTVEGRVFTAMRGLVQARRTLLSLRSGGRTDVLSTENRSVLAYTRVQPRSAPFLALTNFSDVPQSVDAGILDRAGLRQLRYVHTTSRTMSIDDGRIGLPSWGFIWLTGR